MLIITILRLSYHHLPAHDFSRSEEAQREAKGEADRSEEAAARRGGFGGGGSAAYGLGVWLWRTWLGIFVNLILPLRLALRTNVG